MAPTPPVDRRGAPAPGALGGRAAVSVCLSPIVLDGLATSRKTLTVGALAPPDDLRPFKLDVRRGAVADRTFSSARFLKLEQPVRGRVAIYPPSSSPLRSMDVDIVRVGRDGVPFGVRFSSPDAGAVPYAVAIVEARREEADRRRLEAERRRARDRAALRRPLMKAPEEASPPPQRRGGMHVR